MTLVSANFGVGLLGMSYAFHRMGLILGVIALFYVGLLSHLSNIMHLLVKDLTPRRLKSSYEIAYALAGRPSVFLIGAISFLNSFCACLIFYTVLGDTLS